MTCLSETRKLYLRINPCRIHYLKFLLEGYDGMAILSTIDVQSGLVVVRYPSYSQAILFELLADLAADLTRET
ncbi:MAG: DUF4911 domain-containing protein [Proteobacteria bacterium]|nr:DUF4911 domain-containing protein [Pseudomonadota bacterium]MBU4298277.1 DUF4911 domain-containing protein [Pseudomonadota bacterium]